ncbi:uncharacterized protein DS421_20g701480 [Arachis hypogaea]|nr:uncharacterized protein DS421_20g701480 [Arachis hypogaea]
MWKVMMNLKRKMTWRILLILDTFQFYFYVLVYYFSYMLEVKSCACGVGALWLSLEK